MHGIEDIGALKKEPEKRTNLLGRTLGEVTLEQLQTNALIVGDEEYPRDMFDIEPLPRTELYDEDEEE